MQAPWGKAFQAVGTASAKTPRVFEEQRGGGSKRESTENTITDKWQGPSRMFQGLWILLRVTLGVTDMFQAWKGGVRLPFGNSSNGNSGYSAVKSLG